MGDNNIQERPVERKPKKSKKNNGKFDIKKMFNSLGVKKYLVIALAVIMLPLILGYALIYEKIPERQVIIPPVENSTTEASNNDILTPEEISQLNEDSTQAEDKTDKSNEKEEETTARWMAKIIDPTDEEYWFLSIIGADYPLPDKYTPSLSPIIEGSSITVDSRIVAKYQEMYNAAKQDDCILTPYSGYHSYSLQKSTYSRKVNFYVNQGLSQEEAEKKAKTSVLPAGCSEHNAGLAVDIVSASEDFAKTKEYQWLCDHAHEYGFILRYPADKAEITGVSYEPWHWRYVGEEAAKKMADKNECLEEYLGIV